MKVPSLFFFCLVLTFGFYHVSEAASITKRAEGSASPASSGIDLVPIFSSLFNCGTSPSDKLPSATDIRADPTKSINAFLCFILSRITNVGEGMLENVIPTLVESLKSINDSGVIPPPFSTWIHTLVILYEMGNTLRNNG